MFNSVPNIIENVNDKMMFSYNGSSYEFRVPTGLYDAQSLSDTFDRLLTNMGLRGLFSLSADFSTQKTELIASQAGISFNMTNLTLKDILGFNSQTLVSTFTRQVFLSDNIATFNTNNSFLLGCSLVQNGMVIDSKNTEVISNILITEEPGLQVIYNPNNPLQFPCPHLRGDSVSFFTMTLQNERRETINMNGEAFSVRLKLSYTM
jgi:hypothetical protein